MSANTYFDNFMVSTAQIERTTYTLGSQAIATRITGDPTATNNGLFYIFSDHLGSTSVLAYGSGGQIGQKVPGSKASYYPFGSPRATPTQTITDRNFTGQKENMELGLIYYNARFYLPAIARFLTPDTLIPDPNNSQSYNRFSYTLNNPAKFVDPTGHNPAWCADERDNPACKPLVDFAVLEGATPDIYWTLAEKLKIIHGAALVDFLLMKHGSSFLKVYGGTVTFSKTGSGADNLGWAKSKNEIYVYEQNDGATIIGEKQGTFWVAHELGHAFNYALSPNETEPDYTFGQGLIDLAQQGVWVSGELISGAESSTSWLGEYKRNFRGYQSTTGPYVQNSLETASEDFADMFSNYVHNSFASNNFGQARYDFMDSHINSWIALAVSNNE